MHPCRFCHEDLDALPSEANIFPHRIGLCSPTRNEVDGCLLEIEEAEKKRAARALKAANDMRPRQTYKRARLWQVAILCFVALTVLLIALVNL